MGWRDLVVTSSPLPAILPLSDRVEAMPRTVSAVTLHRPLPLLPGWLVAYRDREYRLRGGCDERGTGTVLTCQWDSSTWRVILTDGHRLPLSSIRSVGQTDSTGRIVAAWEVKKHGYDGAGA